MIKRLIISAFLVCFAVGHGEATVHIHQAPASVSAEDGDLVFSHLPVVDAKQRILKKAKERLKKHYKGDEYRFTVKPRWIPQQLLQMNPENVLAVELEAGVQRYTNFEVIYTSRGKRDRLQVQLAVGVKKKVPVVTRRIRRGETIPKDALAYRWVSLLQNRGPLVDSIDELEGKTLRRTLLSGQPVRQSFISKEFLIEAGDQVQVLVQKKGIRVKVTGEARENGAKGEKIKIYSKETRRKYMGEVVRPGLILWKSTL